MTTAVSDLSASTAVTVLSPCRTLRSTLCVVTGLPTLLRYEYDDWSLQTFMSSPGTILSYHRPDSHNLLLHVLLLSGCAVMSASAAPQSAKNQSDTPSCPFPQVFRIRFDLLITVLILTCYTRSFDACLRLLIRTRLDRFSSAPSSDPLSYSFSICFSLFTFFSIVSVFFHFFHFVFF